MRFAISILIFIAASCCAPGAICLADQEPASGGGPPAHPTGNTQDDPAPLAALVGRLGEHFAILAEKSPSSSLGAVAQRMSLTPPDVGPDYDLSNEVFFLHEPPSGPSADGQFGLVVSINFAGSGHVTPPWREVLSSRHLIWIGSMRSGDKQASPAKRAALMLDAIHNVKKLWRVDSSRIYVVVDSRIPAVNMIPLCYADIVSGALHVAEWDWFTKLPVSGQPRFTWDPPKLMVPQAMLAIGRERGRYVLAYHSDFDNKHNLDVLQEGFKANGFRHVDAFEVQKEKIYNIDNYAEDWFERSIEFLDAPRAEIAAREAAALHSPPLIATPASAPAVASPAPQNPAPAASQPSGPAPDTAAKADQALAMAENYVTVQKYDIAREKLKKITEDYPGTPAAKKAANILQEIDGK